MNWTCADCGQTVTKLHRVQTTEERVCEQSFRAFGGTCPYCGKKPGFHTDEFGIRRYNEHSRPATKRVCDDCLMEGKKEVEAIG